MEVALKDLAGSTEFSLDGKKYKKGHSCWYAPAKDRLSRNQAFHDSKSHEESCYGCYPYFGGKYQENITVWVPSKSKIYIPLE